MSILAFNLRVRGKSKIGDLKPGDLASLARFFEPNLLHKLRKVTNPIMRGINLTNEDNYMLIVRHKKFVEVAQLTSKQLGLLVNDRDPICLYKFGAIMTPNEAALWGDSQRKDTNVRHHNTLLRVSHGGIYTKAKLARFGLNDDPNCARCGIFEDLHNKIYSCEYTRRIWNIIIPLTNRLKVSLKNT